MPFASQIYLGLPDGGLEEAEAYLDKAFTEVTADIVPDRIFTTGRNGYDGHPDHIAVHSAALRTAENVRRLGQEITAWALASDGGGELRVQGDLRRKLGSMASHASQTVTSDFTRWGGSDVYTSVILGSETYVVSAGIMSRP